MKQTKELEKTLKEQLAKDEFAAMISHEIKTPLVPIQLHTEMLLKGVLGSLDDKQIKSLHSIHTNTISLMDLVDDMLDITKAIHLFLIVLQGFFLILLFFLCKSILQIYYQLTKTY